MHTDMQQYVPPIIMIPPEHESRSSHDREKYRLINHLLKKKIIKHGLDDNNARAYLFSNGYYRAPLDNRGPLERIIQDYEDNLPEDNGVWVDDIIEPVRAVQPLPVVNKLPHKEWLDKLTGVDGTIDPMKKLWEILDPARNGKVNMSLGELKDFATAVDELYGLMLQRIDYIINARRLDPVKIIYNFIARGYHAFEAILESPDLGAFFIDNEHIKMPDFPNYFKDL
jgi:hypothetical protein